MRYVTVLLLLLTSCMHNPTFMVQESAAGEVTLHWPTRRVAVPVFLDKQAAEWEPTVQRSIDWWNRQVKCGLVFVYVGVREEPELVPGRVIIWASPDDRNYSRIRYDSRTGEISWVQIFHAVDTYQFRPGDAAARKSRHELGHALGLGHDTDSESVMFQQALSGTYRIRSDDLDALCQQYF